MVGNPFSCSRIGSKYGCEMAGRVRNLRVRNGRYSARQVVPTELVAVIGKTELLLDLGQDRRRALERHPAALARLKHEIAIARRTLDLQSGGPCPERVDPRSPEEISALNYFERLSQDEEARNTSPTYAQISINDQYVHELRRAISGAATDRELAELVGDRIDHYRSLGYTAVKPGAQGWRELARLLCHSEYEALERVVERDEGNFDGRSSNPRYAPPELREEVPAVSILGLFDGYLRHRALHRDISEVQKRWTPVFKDLVSYLRHDNAHKLTQRDVKTWREAKLESLAQKTVADVYLTALRTVLNWAVEHEHIPENVAAKVKLKVPKKTYLRERGFTESEALQILKTTIAYSPSAYAKAGKQRASAKTVATIRWVPLLCAFTGARVSEVTQLRRDDIRKIDGRLIARITPEAGTVKTGGFRDVPLHQQLVDLGFDVFIEDAPSGPLVYETVAGQVSVNRARDAGAKLAKWLRANKLVPTGVQPNYGWRHRFKTIGREVGASERVLGAIAGNEGKTVGENYGDVTLTAKIAAIDRLPPFDLPPISLAS